VLYYHLAAPHLQTLIRVAREPGPE
jgi:hypothetical protein